MGWVIKENGWFEDSFIVIRKNKIRSNELRSWINEKEVNKRNKIDWV